MRIPELIAHRGYALRYPENTLPAIEAALTAGARYIEIDVQTSADHVPVLFHDETLERLCGVKGRIRDAELAELGALRAHEPERFGHTFADVPIPTLSAVVNLLASWPAATLFVEIKAEALAHTGIEETYRRCAAIVAPLGRRAVFISFDTDFLLTARWHGWPRLGGVIENWNEHTRPALQAIQPEFLFFEADRLIDSGPLIWPGVHLAVYEVDDPARALALAARGVDLVETFAYAEMQRALGAPSAWIRQTPQ